MRLNKHCALSLHDVNLSKIESRPTREGVVYLFFIDFIGHYQDAEVQAALRELEHIAIWSNAG